jgi:predicted  nucleic acid-binding Zn-ribbon protein
MDNQVAFDVVVASVIAVGGGLLSIIAFFIRQLLSKINRLGLSMTELDKKLAVLISETNRYADRFNAIEQRLKELESEVWRNNTSE